MRLLRKVKCESEHGFIGGSFLKPMAVRYDMLDDSRYGVDKFSVFLNFPYFAVQQQQERTAFLKGDSRHPMRTLLQSRYSLNENVGKDKSQCIRMLDTISLKSCIKKADTSGLNQTASDNYIYVPQMWALIMGSNHVITTGPISDQALLGPALKVKDYAMPHASRRCAFVRISFVNHGMREDVTYPIAQCASWFGLLNKHQEIRRTLERGKEKAASNTYPLMVDRQILADKTWASL